MSMSVLPVAKFPSRDSEYHLWCIPEHWGHSRPSWYSYSHVLCLPESDLWGKRVCFFTHVTNMGTNNILCVYVICLIHICHQASYCSGDALDIYLGDTWFKVSSYHHINLCGLPQSFQAKVDTTLKWHDHPLQNPCPLTIHDHFPILFNSL